LENIDGTNLITCEFIRSLVESKSFKIPMSNDAKKFFHYYLVHFSIIVWRRDHTKLSDRFVSKFFFIPLHSYTRGAMTQIIRSFLNYHNVITALTRFVCHILWESDLSLGIMKIIASKLVNINDKLQLFSTFFDYFQMYTQFNLIDFFKSIKYILVEHNLDLIGEQYISSKNAISDSIVQTTLTEHNIHIENEFVGTADFLISDFSQAHSFTSLLIKDINSMIRIFKHIVLKKKKFLIYLKLSKVDPDFVLSVFYRFCFHLIYSPEQFLLLCSRFLKIKLVNLEKLVDTEFKFKVMLRNSIRFI
jgi:hypothetical protein